MNDQFNKEKIKKELEERRLKKYREFKERMIRLFGNFYSSE